MSTECGFGEKSQQHASIMWMYENRYRFIHTRSVPSTHPIIFHRSCISAINAYVYMYIYGVWITYKIEIAVYNITDYFAMLWQRQQPTDQPPMHEYYTMSTTTEYLEWENIKKSSLISLYCCLFFHYVILKALTSAIISMVNSISKVIKNIFN